jgi:hypothetical protein
VPATTLPELAPVFRDILVPTVIKLAGPALPVNTKLPLVLPQLIPTANPVRPVRLGNIWLLSVTGTLMLCANPAQHLATLPPSR